MKNKKKKEVNFSTFYNAPLFLVRQNNSKILGYEEDLNQSTSSKKKRIRKKKEKVDEPPKERPAEEKGNKYSH